MMMTDFRYCWQNHYVGDFLNELNRSPTPFIGHQHLKLVTNTFGLEHPSPTSLWSPVRNDQMIYLMDGQANKMEKDK